MNIKFVSIKNSNNIIISVSTNRLNARKNFMKHTHHWLELNYVKSGKGSYWIDGKVYKVQEGDIFVINNIERHSLDIDEGQVAEILVIHFDPRFIWSMESDWIDFSFLKIFFERSQNFSHLLDRENPAIESIRKLMFEIEDEFSNKEAEYQAMVKVKLLNILALILRYFKYANMESNTQDLRKQHTKLINKVLGYIDEHVDEDIRLSELADIANMSPSYFSILFKKCYGMSPKEYIIKLRINKAIGYLKSTGKSITEIATICGFNNTANFNKAFRNVTNTTPTSYRK